MTKKRLFGQSPLACDFQRALDALQEGQKRLAATGNMSDAAGVEKIRQKIEAARDRIFSGIATVMKP